MKKFTVLLSVLILGVLLSVSAYSENTSASDTFSVDLQEGNTFPVFTLETLNGKKIPSSRVFDKNKKTIIVTAAEWCPGNRSWPHPDTGHSSCRRQRPRRQTPQPRHCRVGARQRTAGK